MAEERTTVTVAFTPPSGRRFNQNLVLRFLQPQFFGSDWQIAALRTRESSFLPAWDQRKLLIRITSLL